MTVDTVAPNDQARALIGRDHLSYSSVSLYQRCPLQFYFKYVENAEPEFVSSSLVFGQAIHAAIERHFHAAFADEPAPDTDALMDTFDRIWNTEPEIRYGRSETETSLRDQARRMMQAFQASEVSNLDTQLVGIEEAIYGTIIDDCPDILGRIDLMRVSDGRLIITDFKTSRSAWSDAKIDEASHQQLLYAELVRPLAESIGDRPLDIQIEWVVLTKTKSPPVHVHRLEPDPRQIVRTKAMVRRVWNAIVDHHFYPTPSAMSCPSCPFQNRCQAWEGEDHEEACFT